jgi:hypothetical protein
VPTATQSRALFALVWEALARVLGTPPTAAIVRRARRAHTGNWSTSSSGAASNTATALRTGATHP